MLNKCIRYVLDKAYKNRSEIMEVFCDLIQIYQTLQGPKIIQT